MKLAKQQERNAVLKDIKEKIFDFKGSFKSHVTQKQIEEFLKRKEAGKTKPKAATKKASK